MYTETFILDAINCDYSLPSIFKIGLYLQNNRKFKENRFLIKLCQLIEFKSKMYLLLGLSVHYAYSGSDHWLLLMNI